VCVAAGVIYHGDRAITGTADAVHKLKKLVQIIIIMRTLSVSLCVPIMCENGIDGYASLPGTCYQQEAQLSQRGRLLLKP